MLSISTNSNKGDSTKERFNRENDAIIQDKLSGNNSQIKKQINKSQLIQNVSKYKKQKPVDYSEIPLSIISKNMLFFLDLNSLPNYILVCKKTLEEVKTHIFIRLHYLNSEKKSIEQENHELISGIEEKRRQFFEEYEIDPPNQAHAIQLLQTITNNVNRK